MLENNRDEINYHKFLKSVRKSQNVSLEKTAFGVCTKSGMSRVEAGTRLPNKLIRDRLTARLGISGEEYEEYLLPKEYVQWQLRMEIIRCINKKDVDGADEKLKKYDKEYNENRVEKQFVEAMRFMIFEMKGFSNEDLCAQAYTAMVCTVPDMDAAFKGAQLLADQELNLIMEYVRLYIPKVPENDVTAWKFRQYDKVAKYVENSRMDKIAQAKVYSKLACIVSELVLAEYEDVDKFRYALELCTRAIEVLRDRYRLYYFVELNEYRTKLIEQLCSIVEDEVEKKAFEELSHTSMEWANLFQELYKRYDVPVYMENFTYMYTETECNNASEVIRIRRQMMGLPRVKFCGNACDERTLMRIEHGNHNPSMPVVRDLFERVGICAEYKRARVITSNASMIYLSDQLDEKMDNRKHDDAVECFNELIKGINVDILYNEQEMKRVEIILQNRLGSLTNSELTELFTDVMECTLSLDAVLVDTEKYFTRTEWYLIHDFAMYTNDILGRRCRELLENLCFDVVDKEIEYGKLCVYELMISKIFSKLGNEGRYEESNCLSEKLLKESLRLKKLYSIMDCMYNKFWNINKQNGYTNSLIDLQNAKVELEKQLILSQISRNEPWEKFFQQKIAEID